MENIRYVVVLGWITLTVNIIRTNLGMLADLGEPKAMRAWLLAFLYMLLMGGYRKMKPVLAAVQKALNLASYCWH